MTTAQVLAERTLTGPLSVAWNPQHVCLMVPGLTVDAPATLTIDGEPAAFQYTGRGDAHGAEVMVRLGFEPDQTRRLVFTAAEQSSTSREAIALDRDETGRDALTIGVSPCELTVPGATSDADAVAGPFAGFAGFPLEGTIRCAQPFEKRTVRRVNEGPLFVDYELCYTFAAHHSYTLHLRCYRHLPAIAVREDLALGMDARLTLALNPSGTFDRTVSHRGFDFEASAQPTVEPIAGERPYDILCRLQMPPLGEYVGHNNRGWFAFFNEADPARGMLGVLGLYGARWQYPVANIMTVYGRAGRTELDASLEAGQRHWMLYAGPTETQYDTSQPHVFHRLHGEFNAVRLDEHLDLDGQAVFDETCWHEPAVLADEYREKGRRNAERLPPLAHLYGPNRETKQSNPKKQPDVAGRLLVDNDEATRREAIDHLFERFALWVRRFQGERDGVKDYALNVIGFARRLRKLMIIYEILRKDQVLTDDQVGRLNAYFVFAARRIMDEGRWPHSRTWVHPDHPESVRDLYTYGGEHKPDRLVWTNSLPNFQSDPLCALIHLGCLFEDHPDAPMWRQFGIDDLERQLDAYCGESGAWEESINYSFSTLSYFITTFRVLKERQGVDYFQDGRARRFVGWLARFFGLYDPRFGCYTWPAIGNVALPKEQGDLLLAYASQLAADDPLRRQLEAVYQKCATPHTPHENFAVPLAVMADPLPETLALPPVTSEHMDEVGVAMRHRHPEDDQSYLFQKIGFAKDHYENDETAINWYARGTPLVMDYGTYTHDAARGCAHNIVELPDQDPLRRGYLAQSMFSDAVDFTCCEVPVTLKLMHGRVRSFAEIDGPPEPAKYFYLGDQNPTGPKAWKKRLLLFVKPDYIVLLDRVYGAVPHRYNLHATVDRWQRDGAHLHGQGRFDLDVHAFIQHPAACEHETGEFVPGPQKFGEGSDNPHRQQYVRLYNHTDDIYRTLIFAEPRDQPAKIEAFGDIGMRVTTEDYTDYVFANDQRITTRPAEGVAFRGCAGWIRQWRDGRVAACVPNGEWIEAFGVRITGRGPWHYNLVNDEQVVVTDGPPRSVHVQR